MIDPEELLRKAGLVLGGSLDWKQLPPEHGPGVYVVSVQDPSSLGPKLPLEHQDRWKADQAVVYIGRSKHLRKRLQQFYKHKFGEKRPHAGGQAILNLPPSTVHWAAALDYPAAEERLIKAFEEATGAKPFGNRVAAARSKKTI